MRAISLLAALPLVALAGGCYASVGPTFGYRVGEGFTIGAETDMAYLAYVHGNAGFFMSRGGKENGWHLAATYGGAGPGFMALFDDQQMGGVVAAEIGGITDYHVDGDTFVMGRLGGAPSLLVGDMKDHHNLPLLFNCMLGINFWSGGVWFYVSPQIGTAIPIPTGFSY